MNTYWRLLGFAKPIEKYAIPYFFYTLFYSLFNTFNFVMIIPILNSLFDPAKQIAQVTSMPAFDNTSVRRVVSSFDAFCVYVTSMISSGFTLFSRMR